MGIVMVHLDFFRKWKRRLLRISVYGYIWTLGFITSGYYKLILPVKSQIRFTFFISLLFSFIPQIIISIIRKTGSEAGTVSRKYSCEDYGILTCLILMAIFNTTFSFQMVKECLWLPVYILWKWNRKWKQYKEWF